MADKLAPAADESEENGTWRGIDFSGVIVVLGAGTGRLIRLLNRQAAASEGSLLVASLRAQDLRALVPLKEEGPLTLVRARTRQVPVRAETVDLLAVSGVLREVPEGRFVVLFEEFWRVLVPGGQLRISDVIQPSEAEYNRAWTERNRIVRKLGGLLGRPTALAVNLPLTAKAIRLVGFENLAVSILPGHALTDAWLEEVANGVRLMASRIADKAVRDEILNQDLDLLMGAYSQGGQRAAERFVLRATRAGDLALDMEAPFTEEDAFGRV